VLVEVGELRSSSVWPVSADASGEITWLIGEGALVGPDDVVARIDDNQTKLRLEEKEREAVPLRSDVELRRQALESVRVLGPLKVRLAQIGLAKAQWQLDDLKLHPTEEELAGARLDLRVAALKHEKAAGELERTRQIAARGLATDTELRQRKLEALGAQADAQLAGLKLSVLSAGADRLTLESARLDAEKSRLIVEEERFASEADIVIAEKDLEVGQANLAQGERELEHYREYLTRYQVKAGASGRVSFPEVWKGTETMSRREVGESIRVGHDLCQVVDPAKLEARLFVNEVDALALREGLPATVRLTALPGVEVPGRVASVSMSAFDKNEKLGRLALEKAGKAGVSVVEVKVRLDLETKIVDADGAAIDLGDLRGGHTATVEIELDPAGPGAPEAAGRKPRAPAPGPGVLARPARVSSPKSAGGVRIGGGR
jgi:multidrug resistance efflux pump